MKFIIKFILLLAIVAVVASFSKMGNNHVIIFMTKYRVDLSLFGLILIFILGYVVIAILWWLFVSAFNLPRTVKTWYLSYKNAKSTKYLLLAQINYFAGSYVKCLKQATDILSFEKDKHKRFVALLLTYKACGYLHINERQHEVVIELEKYTENKWQEAKLNIFAKDEK